MKFSAEQIRRQRARSRAGDDWIDNTERNGFIHIRKSKSHLPVALTRLFARPKSIEVMDLGILRGRLIVRPRRTNLLIARGVIHCVGNVREGAIDTGTEGCCTGDDADGDEGCNQAVFNSCCAGLILKEACEKFVHDHVSLFGWSFVDLVSLNRREHKSPAFTGILKNMVDEI
jgi:hypothetical protein